MKKRSLLTDVLHHSFLCSEMLSNVAALVVLGGLLCVSLARAQSQSILNSSQTSDKFQGLPGIRGRAVDSIFTASHQAFKLGPVQTGSRGDAGRNLGARTVVVQAGVSHQ